MLSLKDCSPSKLLNPLQLSFLIYEMGLLIFISQGCWRNKWNSLCGCVTTVPEVPQMLVMGLFWVKRRDTARLKYSNWQAINTGWKRDLEAELKIKHSGPMCGRGALGKENNLSEPSFGIWTKRWKHLPGKGVRGGTKAIHSVSELGQGKESRPWTVSVNKAHENH